MKTNEELKKELHKLIDSMEDNELLTALHEDILPSIIENYSKEMTDEDHDQHDGAIPGLDEALNTPNAIEPLSIEEFQQLSKKFGK
ncbi:MAG: hypothetical protein JST58_18000 [Bacteroidetes bacterium]|nr:hypothetical protein [Bacteroidota bacterium]